MNHGWDASSEPGDAPAGKPAYGREMGFLRDRGDEVEGERFQMREKLLAIGDDYWIENAPKSDSYGKYLSLSKLQSKFGATSSVRNGVKNAFKSQGITAKIDVTHLRASATISIGKAQKINSSVAANSAAPCRVAGCFGLLGSR
jgi:Pro-kumamolisin, activation domain